MVIAINNEGNERRLQTEAEKLNTVGEMTTKKKGDKWVITKWTSTK